MKSVLNELLPCSNKWSYKDQNFKTNTIIILGLSKALGPVILQNPKLLPWFGFITRNSTLWLAQLGSVAPLT